MRAQVTTVGPLAAASANNIALSQTLGAAGSVALNGSATSGGVATLDKPRRVLITSAGNDSGITFALTGTNWSGAAISEVITGGNASAVSSRLDYATLTGILASGATAAAITVGTNGIAASPWLRMDEYATPQIGFQCGVTGTANYTVQGSWDDPNDSTNPVVPSLMTWINSTDVAVVGATASAQSTYASSPRFVRVLLNSGSGSVRLTVNQFSGDRR